MGLDLYTWHKRLLARLWPKMAASCLSSVNGFWCSNKKANRILKSRLRTLLRHLVAPATAMMTEGCVCLRMCVCACVMHACRLGCSSGATHVVLHKQEDTAATARRLHNQRTFPSYSRRMIFLATCCQTVAFRWRGSKAPERSQLFQFVSISCFRIVLFRMCCSYLFGSFLSNSIKTIKVLIS